MPPVIFRSSTETCRFLNPFKNNEAVDQTIETRQDPLLGHQSLYNPGLEDKRIFAFPPTNRDYLEKLGRESEKNCFLCEGRWALSSPMYEEALIPKGRLVSDESVLFPNLFPIAARHAIVMVGKRHFRGLGDFPPGILAEAFRLSFEFIRRSYEKEPQCPFFTINCNYLFPAGASSIHPHLQILGSGQPFTHHFRLLEASRTYLGKQGSCYFDDLVETEKAKGERWIGQTGGTAWLCAYSPLGANEVQAIGPDSRFTEWEERDIDFLALGLSRVFSAYHGMGLSSLNFSMYSGPLGLHSPEFRCLMRIVTRQNVMPDYRGDDYYLQKLLDGEMMIWRPEELAGIIRKAF
jgi:galactose-1-phosphate uridylyltransferase